MDEAFTPTADEVAWAAARTTSDQHRLALLVSLKGYQRLGYFPNLLPVPVEVIVHVRGHAGVGADVAAVHESQATAKWHRGLVRERLGVKYRAGEVRVLAEQETVQISGRSSTRDLNSLLGRINVMIDHHAAVLQ